MATFVYGRELRMDFQASNMLFETERDASEFPDFGKRLCDEVNRFRVTDGDGNDVEPWIPECGVAQHEGRNRNLIFHKA